MKIVLLEPLGISDTELGKLSARLTAQGHQFVAYDTVETSEEGLIQRAKDADILMLANHPLSDNVIRACSRLKYISVAFVGIDHIGQAACVERSIPVSNAASYCTHAVAELAVGLCLDCLRNISTCNQVIRAGGTKTGLVGHQLFGRTVGIIGTGATGCHTAQLFKAFGCRVLGFSRREREEAKAIGIEYTSLEALLRESDIVSLHTPLTAETRNLLDDKRIAMMKPSAIIINTARGGIVDSAAAAAALNEGRLAAMGTDVFETEPPLPEDHPLLHAAHVVATPHVAFATEESLQNRARITFDNVYAWLNGVVQNRMI